MLRTPFPYPICLHVWIDSLTKLTSVACGLFVSKTIEHEKNCRKFNKHKKKLQRTQLTFKNIYRATHFIMLEESLQNIEKERKNIETNASFQMKTLKKKIFLFQSEKKKFWIRFFRDNKRTSDWDSSQN